MQEGWRLVGHLELSLQLQTILNDIGQHVIGPPPLCPTSTQYPASTDDAQRSVAATYYVADTAIRLTEQIASNGSSPRVPPLRDFGDARHSPLPEALRQQAVTNWYKAFSSSWCMR